MNVQIAMKNMDGGFPNPRREPIPDAAGWGTGCRTGVPPSAEFSRVPINIEC